MLRKSFISILISTTCLAGVQSSTVPQFVNATIKSAAVSDRGWGNPGTVRFLNEGHVVAEKALFGVLVQAAYEMPPFQIASAPDWSERWDIDASAPTGSTTAQMRSMLQSLLQDRFKLKVHRETRDTHVYQLTIAPGGLKSPDPARGCRAPGSMPPPPAPPPEPGKSPALPQALCGSIFLNLNSLTEAQLIAGQVSITQLAGVLSNALGGAVIDKTNLDSKIDLSVSFTPDSALAGIPMPAGHPLPPTGSVSIFSALEQQAGLRLEPAHNVEILIIDYAEKPSGIQR